MKLIDWWSSSCVSTHEAPSCLSTAYQLGVSEFFFLQNSVWLQGWTNARVLHAQTIKRGVQTIKWVKQRVKGSTQRTKGDIDRRISHYLKLLSKQLLLKQSWSKHHASTCVVSESWIIMSKETYTQINNPRKETWVKFCVAYLSLDDQFATCLASLVSCVVGNHFCRCQKRSTPV